MSIWKQEWSLSFWIWQIVNKVVYIFVDAEVLAIFILPLCSDHMFFFTTLLNTLLLYFSNKYIKFSPKYESYCNLLISCLYILCFMVIDYGNLIPRDNGGATCCHPGHEAYSARDWKSRFCQLMKEIRQSAHTDIIGIVQHIEAFSDQVHTSLGF
jgi:hypothetical protein